MHELRFAEFCALLQNFLLSRGFLCFRGILWNLVLVSDYVYFLVEV